MNLRHLIEIGRYISGMDQWGDPIPTQWQEVCKVWASIEGLSGSLYFQARLTTEQTDHRVIIRYRSDIEPGMIIRYAGREFTIQSVLDKEGKRRWLELMCREMKPA